MIIRSKSRMNPPRAPPRIAPKRGFVEVEELKSDVELEELEPFDGIPEEMIEVTPETTVATWVATPVAI